MAAPPQLYDITVWLETRNDPRGAAESLLEALGGDQAAAHRARIRTTDHGVAVAFPEVKGGDPHVDELSEILPVVRSLIVLGTARVRAGLEPSQRIAIDVQPSAVHTQDELRHA